MRKMLGYNIAMASKGATHASIHEEIAIVLFITLSLWWIVLFFVFGAELTAQNLYWAATYQLLAWWGGIYALVSSRSWGGWKSVMGRGIIFFGLGLLLQGFGQTTFSIYTTLLNVEIPYPSIADIGYFGSIFFYIAGMASMAKVAGASARLRNIGGKLLALLFPAIMLMLSYAMFLQGYEFDWSAPLRTFLDFGYPFGQALYVSIAVLALLSSKNMLGGVMRGPMLFLMMALVVQYVADFNFLFQAANGAWLNGGHGDFLYLLSYFLMGLSLVRIERVIREYQSA